MDTLHNVCKMHDPKDIILVEDDFVDTILPTSYEKGSYELEKDACVMGFTHLLKPLQDVVNDLYMFDIC